MHPTQTKILELLRSQGGKFKNFSYRSLGDAVGIHHPQQIKHHLGQLARRGLVLLDQSSRVLRQTAIGGVKSSAIVAIPIVGAANCGPATRFADQEVEGMIQISKKLILNREQNLFAIRAVGSSMNRADVSGVSIDDGDYVIVDGSQFVARDSDYVLAVIDDFGVVKKFKRGSNTGEIELLSESTEEHPPIHIHPDDQQFIINGKVIYIMKKPKVKWSD